MVKANRGSFSSRIRIIWAIAAKDVLDALKNRTTLGVILSVVFLIVFYRVLPGLESGNLLPRLALYDAGSSRIISDLDDSSELDLFEMASLEDVEWYVGDRELVVLGLVLPADFDRQVEAGESIELEGYVAHWASDAAVAEVREFFESELGELAGQPVHISVEGNVVHTRPDSRGMAFAQSIMMVFALLITGVTVTPHLMLEERQTRTLEALLVAPVSSGQLVIGKALAGLFYCLIATGVTFAFNTALITQWGMASLAAVCGSLFAVSLGLLLGSIIQSRQQLSFWAWVTMLPLILAVVLVLMSDILPDWAVKALQWVPTAALAEIFRASFSDQSGLARFGPQMALILGWTVPLLVAVVWIVRRTDRR
jgi:ABC-2 type transport system permease protein